MNNILFFIYDSIYMHLLHIYLINHIQLLL